MRGTEHLRHAVQADTAGDSAPAVAEYMKGLEFLLDRLKWEQDPAAKAGITAKVWQVTVAWYHKLCSL